MKTFTADRTRMLETTSAYGISEREITQVTDPRVLNLIRDFMLLRNKTDKAAIEAKQTRKRGVTIRSRSAQRATRTKDKQLQDTINRAAKSKDRRTKADAVAALIS